MTARLRVVTPPRSARRKKLWPKAETLPKLDVDSLDRAHVEKLRRVVLRSGVSWHRRRNLGFLLTFILGFVHVLIYGKENRSGLSTSHRQEMH